MLRAILLILCACVCAEAIGLADVQHLYSRVFNVKRCEADAEVDSVTTTPVDDTPTTNSKESALRRHWREKYARLFNVIQVEPSMSLNETIDTLKELEVFSGSLENHLLGPKQRCEVIYWAKAGRAIKKAENCLREFDQELIKSFNCVQYVEEVGLPYDERSIYSEYKLNLKKPIRYRRNLELYLNYLLDQHLQYCLDSHLGHVLRSFIRRFLLDRMSIFRQFVNENGSNVIFAKLAEYLAMFYPPPGVLINRKPERDMKKLEELYEEKVLKLCIILKRPMEDEPIQELVRYLTHSPAFRNQIQDRALVEWIDYVKICDRLSDRAASIKRHIQEELGAAIRRRYRDSECVSCTSFMSNWFTSGRRMSELD